MSTSKKISIHRLLHSHEWPEIERCIRTCHLSRHKGSMKKYKACYEALLEHFPRRSVMRIRFDLSYIEGKWNLSCGNDVGVFPGAYPRRAIMLNMDLDQQISEAEVLARWLVWIAKVYGTEWRVIREELENHTWHMGGYRAGFSKIIPLDPQTNWDYWTKPKRRRTLPEETRRYLERRMPVQRFWLSSDSDRADNRHEMICRIIETHAEAIAALRGCRHLFVRFCSSRKYCVTCEEATSILDSLHKATGGTAEVVFDSDTLSWTGWVLVVQIWVGVEE